MANTRSFCSVEDWPETMRAFTEAWSDSSPDRRHVLPRSADTHSPAESVPAQRLPSCAKLGETARLNTGATSSGNGSGRQERPPLLLT